MFHTYTCSEDATLKSKFKQNLLRSQPISKLIDHADPISLIEVHQFRKLLFVYYA